MLLNLMKKSLPEETAFRCALLGTFRTLGPEAVGSVPAIIVALQQSKDPKEKVSAMRTLEAIGPAGVRSALPMLTAIAAQEPDYDARTTAERLVRRWQR